MRYKILTWVWMVALLAGQSYAYALLPCESQAVASAVHFHEQPMMDHSQHVMSDDKKPSMPCCEQECSCPPGACASVAITDYVNHIHLDLVAEVSGSYQFSMQDFHLALLRKPPIFS